jgi:hypothetical protein
MRARVWDVAAFALAIGLTAAISVRTNTEVPLADTAAYLDMAEHGLAGNPKLVAPFAYRPVVPLGIGLLARAFHADPWRTFEVAAHVWSVVFLLACFSFARSQGASPSSALIAMVAIGLYYCHLKWHLFLVGMIDLYAYPLVILAFWLILERRYDACLVLSAAGLLVKEWMLVPLLTQAIVRVRGEGLRASARSLALTAVALVVCFVVPRLLIPVAKTVQDVDPFNDWGTLTRLLSYPLSGKRDLNIVFSYLAYWLPALLLLTRTRAEQVWHRLGGRRFAVGVHMALVFPLVMYGGTNIMVFVGYMVVAELLVLCLLLDDAPWWEAALMLVVVARFNLIWLPSPSLDRGLRALTHYGGYHDVVTARSWMRFAELTTYLVAFPVVRWAVSHSLGRVVAARRRLP